MCRAALFLDRDGVINVDHGYVHRAEDFEFIAGIFDLARAAHDLGLALVVVTNQSGIARGYYGEAEFQALSGWMAGRFAAAGAPLAAVYHCPYHPVDGIGEWRRESEDRKPAPGMLLQAARDLDLDLSASWLLGDRASDIEAGYAAGLKQLMLLNRNPAIAAPHGAKVVASLKAARDWLISSIGEPAR